MSEFILSAAANAQIQALGQTNQNIQTISRQLSSGLRVSDPSIDPSAWYQAKALTDDVDSRNARLQNLQQAKQTIQVALDAGKAINKLIDQMQAQLNNVMSQPTFASEYAGVEANNSAINNAAKSWDQIAKQINGIVNDASYNGVNLLADTNTNVGVWGADSLSVDMGNGHTFSFQGQFMGVASAVTGFNLSGPGSHDLTVYNGDDLQSSKALNYAITGGTNGNWTVTAASAATPGQYIVANPNSPTDTSAGTWVTADARYISNATTRAMSGESFLMTGVGYATMALAGPGAFGGTAAQLGLQLNFSSIYALFTTQAGRDAAVQDIATARNTLNAYMTQLGAASAYLDTQVDYQKNMVNIETAGAQKLTGADMNAAGAQLTAAQTLQKVAVNAINAQANADASGALTLIQYLNASRRF